MQTTLMLTSSEHTMMLRATTNGNLCDFLRSSVAFYPHESQEKKVNNINDIKRNTLPVLYNKYNTYKC